MQSPIPAAAPPITRAPSADLRISAAAATAAPSGGGGTAGAAEIEPLEQLIAGGRSEIQHADLQVLHNIGHGSSGVVQKVLHTPSSSVLALKIIPVEADEFRQVQQRRRDRDYGDMRSNSAPIEATTETTPPAPVEDRQLQRAIQVLLEKIKAPESRAA